MMRLKNTVLGFLMLLGLIFPFSSYAQVLAPSETPLAVTEEEVRKFLDEYVARYTRMDVDAFMALFSKEALENRMLPYADIYERHRKNFSHSISLSYNLQVYFIQSYSRSAFVSGRYEVVQSLKPKGQQHIFRGNIQWNLVREDGTLKIMDVNYGRNLAR